MFCFGLVGGGGERDEVERKRVWRAEGEQEREKEKKKEKITSTTLSLFDPSSSTFSLSNPSSPSIFATLFAAT